eukprot:SAG11_NODE_1279_length_5314_cov_3.403835_2_plen_432_part_00
MHHKMRVQQDAAEAGQEQEQEPEQLFEVGNTRSARSLMDDALPPSKQVAPAVEAGGESKLEAEAEELNCIEIEESTDHVFDFDDKSVDGSFAIGDEDDGEYDAIDHESKDGCFTVGEEEGDDEDVVVGEEEYDDEEYVDDDEFIDGSLEEEEDVIDTQKGSGIDLDTDEPDAEIGGVVPSEEDTSRLAPSAGGLLQAQQLLAFASATLPAARAHVPPPVATRCSCYWGSGGMATARAALPGPVGLVAAGAINERAVALLVRALSSNYEHELGVAAAAFLRMRTPLPRLPGTMTAGAMAGAWPLRVGLARLPAAALARVCAQIGPAGRQRVRVALLAVGLPRIAQRCTVRGAHVAWSLQLVREQEVRSLPLVICHLRRRYCARLIEALRKHRRPLRRAAGRKSGDKVCGTQLAVAAVVAAARWRAWTWILER